MPTPTTCTLDVLAPADRARVGRLLDDAISKLWYTSPDCAPDGTPDGTPDDDDDYLGCCPVCCAPCAVIAELYRAGQLDAWVRADPTDPTRSSTWDAERDQVGRQWLLRAWQRANTLNCHDEAAGQDDIVIDLLAQLHREITGPPPVAP